MWELDYKESWELKNWCFWMWCWRRLLRVPWTARKSNLSILRKISLEYSLEGLRLKWNSNTFGHLMWRTDSWEKTLMLGKIEGGRRRGYSGWDGWMASPTKWSWSWANSRRLVKDREACHAPVHGVAKSQTQLSDWMTTRSILWPLIPLPSHVKGQNGIMV